MEKTITIEEFIARAKALRAGADEAEREFMEWLLVGEQTPTIWDGSGFTFLQFVEHHGICNGLRYHAWKRGRERLTEALGEKRAASLPVETTIACAKLSRPDDVREAVTRLETWSGTNGTTPSPSAANRIVREVKTAGAVHRSRVPTLTQALEEIEKLKAKIKTLEEENSALRVEVRKLRRAKKAAA